MVSPPKACLKEQVQPVAASRKRGTAAIKGDDSRPSGPVAKRKRLVTGCSIAEVHNVVSGVGEKESTQSPPKEHDNFAEAGLKDAEVQSGKQLFLLDLFCGTAGVTAAFRACGGDALGIDHIIDKRRVKGPCLKGRFDEEGWPGNHNGMDISWKGGCCYACPSLRHSVASQRNTDTKKTSPA